MKYLIALASCVLIACSSFAQSISGNMNTEGTNLKYGSVDIYKNEKLVASVLTDKLGNFSIALDTGMYVCVYNYAGYEPIKKEIHVTKDENADVSMKADPTALKKYDADKSSYESSKRTIADKSIYAVPSKASRLTSAEYGLIEPSTSTGGLREGVAGKLTAGEINDFSKWKLWQDITDSEFAMYSKMWNIAPSGRYTVVLQSQNKLPIVDAQVQLMLNQSPIFTTRTDNTGKAECWLTIKNEKPELKGDLSIYVQVDGKQAVIKNVKPFEKGLNHQQLTIECQQLENVDIAFVVDATGSMGDEISYLQAEMNDVIYQTKMMNAQLNFRFANVYYRDHGDQYVTKTMNFSRILTESAAFIDNQFAGGGGDYPEAVEVALDTALNKLSWSEHARTRILFLVLDAPPHNTPEIQDKMSSLIQLATEKGVRIVPIASSGIDKSTEYLMRALALGTNGTYTFLTDDSGIGYGHIKPTTDNFKVETLNELLIRLIKSYIYLPTCTNEQPESGLNYPDSVVSTQINDSIDSVKTVDTIPPISWSYYPNPTNGIVTIIPNTDIEELYISDLSGKVLQIHSHLKKDQRFQVDLSEYATGIYLIRIVNDKGQWLSGKVILQRTS